MPGLQCGEKKAYLTVHLDPVRPRASGIQRKQKHSRIKENEMLVSNRPTFKCWLKEVSQTERKQQKKESWTNGRKRTAT